MQEEGEQVGQLAAKENLRLLEMSQLQIYTSTHTNSVITELLERCESMKLHTLAAQSTDVTATSLLSCQLMLNYFKRKQANSWLAC